VNTRVLPAITLCLISATVWAQEPDPASAARLKIGPVALTPTLTLNFGVDTNVFNTADNQLEDFTLTVGPGVRTWIRLGKARMTTRSQFDYLYFQKFASERSLNTNNEVKLEVPLGRLKPYVRGSFIDTNERPSYEIDVRARHQERSGTAGVDLRLVGRTRLDVSAYQTDVDFDNEAVFSGMSLYQVLNRKSEGANLTVRHALTPLTTILVATEAQQDRFEFMPLRDAESFRVVPGVEFDAFALIQGTAQVGFFNYDSLAPGQPDYRTWVAEVNLTHTVRGTTRLGLRMARDIEYSYELGTPSYLNTGVAATVTQRITTRWDVQGSVGVQRLGYQSADITGQSTRSRTDRVNNYGGGFGFHLGSGTRIGVNADYFRRRSAVLIRDYDGIRGGMSVTYGF
jgi:hypothetical protein